MIKKKQKMEENSFEGISQVLKQKIQDKNERGIKKGLLQKVKNDTGYRTELAK